MIELHISRHDLLQLEKKIKMLTSHNSYLFRIMDDMHDSSIRNSRKDFIVLKEVLLLMLKKCYVKGTSLAYEQHMPVFLKRSCIFGQKQLEDFIYSAYSKVSNPDENLMDHYQQKVFGLFICSGDTKGEHIHCKKNDLPEVVFKFTNNYFLYEKLTDSQKYEYCCNRNLK